MTPLTITEIRDQIAEWEGWDKPTSADPFWGGINKVRHRDDHPIPYTLDEAAKLPEGWLCTINNHVTCEGQYANGPLLHQTLALAQHENLMSRPRLEVIAPTEIEARFRLRHAAMKAERGIA